MNKKFKAIHFSTIFIICIISIPILIASLFIPTTIDGINLRGLPLAYFNSTNENEFIQSNCKPPALCLGFDKQPYTNTTTNRIEMAYLAITDLTFISLLLTLIYFSFKIFYIKKKKIT